jgi:hypothetical protein
MRAILMIAGIVLALFAAMHVFVTWEHWHQVGPDRESVFEPALTALVSAGLSIWAFRRARRGRAAA